MTIRLTAELLTRLTVEGHSPTMEFINNSDSAGGHAILTVGGERFPADSYQMGVQAGRSKSMAERTEVDQLARTQPEQKNTMIVFASLHKKLIIRQV
ncbi:unnamed protein product [Choristocarpus tenellus]